MSEIDNSESFVTLSFSVEPESPRSNNNSQRSSLSILFSLSLWLVPLMLLLLILLLLLLLLLPLLLLLLLLLKSVSFFSIFDSFTDSVLANISCFIPHKGEEVACSEGLRSTDART